jgi:hypothetical protein
VTGDGADQIDGIEDDASPSIVDDGDAIDKTSLAVRRRRRKYANQFRGEWLHLLLPPRWQCTGSSVLLPQARRKVARAGVVALNNGIVLTPEVGGLLRLAILIRVTSASAFAPALVGKKANGGERTCGEEGNDLPAIHG